MILARDAGHDGKTQHPHHSGKEQSQGIRTT